MRLIDADAAKEWFKGGRVHMFSDDVLNRIDHTPPLMPSLWCGVRIATMEKWMTLNISQTSITVTQDVDGTKVISSAPTANGRRGEHNAEKDIHIPVSEA